MTVKELRDLLDWHRDDDIVVIDPGDTGFPREITEAKFTAYPYRWSRQKECFIKRKRDVLLLTDDTGSVVSHYPSF